MSALIATTTIANAADDSPAPATAKPKKSAKGVSHKPKKPSAPKAEKTEPKQDVAASEPAPEPKPEPAKSEPPKDAPKDPPRATVVVDTRSSADPAADRHPEELSEGAREAAERRISIAPVAGFATNNLNLGFGLRAGYTIPMRNGNGVYLGGQFMYHLGYSNESTLFGKTIGSSISVLYPSFEAGYDIRFNRLVVRPYGGIGLMVVTFSSKGLGSSSGLGGLGSTGDLSYNALAFYPGCQVSYDIPSTRIFVGGDARVLLAASGGVGASFGVFGTGGVRF